MAVCRRLMVSGSDFEIFMARKAQQVTEAELAILSELWARTKMTVRELAEVLYGGNSASELATVQKLLTRLESKGCVTRRRDCWPYEFQANIDREELIHRRLQLTADELCDGSLSPLLSHLVRTAKLSASDRAKLHELIDDETADGSSSTSKGKGVQRGESSAAKEEQNVAENRSSKETGSRRPKR